MFCSFCGKPHATQNKLIGNSEGSSYICESCVATCSKMLKEFKPKTINFTCPKPNKIKEFLDEYIIGQVEAKKILSVAVYNHYKRINYNQGKPQKNDITLGKSNVLLVGPTGSGKTYLTQTIAKILNVPFASCDATTFTEAGYVGEDVESVLLKLVQNAGGDVALAEKGIVYIDEIDKIAKKAENKLLPKDPSGEGVQQALLKLMEGTIVSLNQQGKRMGREQNIEINTDNILFICGGAFVGLDKIIEAREGSTNLGFITQEKVSIKSERINPIDLTTFGLIPELVGRLPVVASLKELTEKELVDILTIPKNCLVEQYKQMFLIDNVNLEIEKNALKSIAQKAIKLKSGARALRSIMENVLLDDMYNIPNSEHLEKVVVTLDKNNEFNSVFIKQDQQKNSVKIIN